MFVERTGIDSPAREAGFQERFGGSYPHDDTNLRLGKAKGSDIVRSLQLRALSQFDRSWARRLEVEKNR